MQLKFQIKIIIMFLVATAFLFNSAPATEASQASVLIDQETIKKGYTVTLDGKNFKLGIVPEIIDQEVTVDLKTKPAKNFPTPQGKKRISSIYQYDVVGYESNPIILQKPAYISVNYNSDTVFPKELGFWNRETEQWQILPATVDYQNRMIKAITHLPFSQVAAFEPDIEANPPKTVRLDLATVEKGYTVYNQDQSFALGILPESIDQKLSVNLKEVANPAPAPENRQLISRVYQFDIRAGETIVFSNPVWLKIGYYRETDLLKQIYYYDQGQEQWVHLPSQADPDNHLVKAAFHLKYAKVAVMADSRFLSEGIASWYRDSRYPYGAANNDYPYEAKLRVTNLDNGQSVIVQKYSEGPFVQGRVIDLVLEGFCAIANRYDGLARVKVEPVEVLQ